MKVNFVAQLPSVACFEIAFATSCAFIPVFFASNISFFTASTFSCAATVALFIASFLALLDFAVASAAADIIASFLAVSALVVASLFAALIAASFAVLAFACAVEAALFIASFLAIPIAFIQFNDTSVPNSTRPLMALYFIICVPLPNRTLPVLSRAKVL